MLLTDVIKKKYKAMNHQENRTVLPVVRNPFAKLITIVHMSFQK